MSTGIQQGAAAVAALERWQDMIASNIASSAVAGHKKTSFSVEAQELGSISSNTGNGFDVLLASKMPVASGSVSFSDGNAVSTGKPTDCAIQGAGFFVVKTDLGNVYTRNGEFHLNSERTLVDSLGREVLGTDGKIQFTAGEGDINIDSQGNIYQGTIKTGKLKITNFENPNNLVRGEGGFISLDETTTGPIDINTPKIMAGFIESSNTETIQEMANLIKATRAHEANLKVIGQLDQRMERMTRTLGNIK